MLEEAIAPEESPGVGTGGGGGRRKDASAAKSLDLTTDGTGGAGGLWEASGGGRPGGNFMSESLGFGTPSSQRENC